VLKKIKELSRVHNKTLQLFSLVALLGLCLGVAMPHAGELAYKWVFVVVLMGCFPVFVVTIGSLKKALEALLIFSLSMQMDFHPWYSDQYAPGMPITLTGLLLLALYILWLFGPRLRGASISLFPQVTIPFGLIVVWSGLSFLVAAEPSYVLARFPHALAAFLLFLYVANLVKSPADIAFVIKCIAVTVTFSAVLGICQYFAGSSFDFQFLGGREAQLALQYGPANISRVSGFLGHANNLALFLSALLPVVLGCAIRVGGYRLRLLCLISFGLGLVTLVLTYSRGGWMAFFISVFLIAIFLLKRRGRKQFSRAAVRVVGLGLVALILVFPLLPSVMARLTEDDYGAARSRIPMARTALEMIGENLLTGVGLGNYRYVVPDYDNNPIADRKGKPMSVHNIYLLTAAELGIFALIIFIWILVLFFRSGIRTLRLGDKGKALLAVGLLAGLAGFCVHGMVEDISIGHPGFVVLSFMGGLLTALGQSRNQEPRLYFYVRGRDY